MLPKRRLSHAQGYLALGLLAEAEAEVAQLAGPDAETTEALAVRASIAQEKRDWPALRDVARELIRREGADVAAWVSLAYATRRANSVLAAEMILLQAEKLFPQEAIVQFNLGCYACQRGDLATARRRVAQAITLDPAYRDCAATDPDLEPLRASNPTGLLPLE